MPNQKTFHTHADSTSENFRIEPSVLLRPSIDIPRNEALLRKSVDDAMKQDLFGSKVSLGDKQKYDGSKLQVQTYENLEQTDPLYARYISDTYGSYRNFLFVNGIKVGDQPPFDPRYDQKADVTIITKERYYKSDHISPNEAIMEALSGICTVDYLKRDGMPNRLVGTLNKDLIGTNDAVERVNFFSPLKGNKIVFYNLIKRGWSSFFMRNLIRFVKDDTIGLE